MNFIEKKIESLGGVDYINRKKSGKLRDKIMDAEKPPAAVVALIDQFGYAMFNETIGCKTITKIPVAGKKWTEIGVIFGWGNDESGVRSNLENLKDEDNGEGYFPLAEGYPGDMICISLKGKNKGKIFYWCHDEGEFYTIAKSFKEFVMSWEKEKEEKKKKGQKEPTLISAWFADDL